MKNLIVITPTWGTRGESFIVDSSDVLIEALTTEPLEDGTGPEYRRLLPEDENKILNDYQGERKLIYLSPPSKDDWYLAKIIY